MAEAKLTEKQKRFCEYYIQNPNATLAAERAGYSKKTAYKIGSENLMKPQILEYINESMQKMQSERIADANEILEYLTKVMRGTEKGADISDRNRAAELLGKRYGLWVDKQEVTASFEPVTIIDDIPIDAD